MTTRVAACHCGKLRAVCEGEPVRVSVCHCLECQRRTGSAFGVSARYPKEKVRAEGPSRQYSRIADSGFRLTFDFCPSCGTTIHWHLDQFPEVTAVAALARGQIRVKGRQTQWDAGSGGIGLPPQG